MGEMWNTFRQIVGKKEKGYIQLFSPMEADGWNTYPRPRMRRQNWMSLNGIWKIGDKNIRVPYPPQSELSGYDAEDPCRIPEELLYERTFRLPEEYDPKHRRILLHFGAVDQIAQVFVNGKPVGFHEGGYLPFSMDITEVLHSGEKENVLSLLAEDRLDHTYPWGKQRRDRGGMWYTPVSGIWQTVWLEEVPEIYIQDLIFTQETASRIRLSVRTVPKVLSSRVPSRLEVTLDNGKVCCRTGEGGEFLLDMDSICREEGTKPRLWSVDDPYLYACRITLGEDCVESYFALRTVEIRKVGGYSRICLNGEPVFLKGVLDQGYFCDGLFLPPTPAGYEADIRNMKELGFNMLRKHIKVEPEQFYYDCDRLGMLVMQDMVNSGPYHFLPDTGLPTVGIRGIPERGRKSLTKGQQKRKDFFLQHSKAIQEQLYNHPCVIGYTVFNEGWGQFDSRNVGDELRAKDPSRFYDYTSGWFERGGSQVESIHEYFHIHPYAQKEKPLLLSECGGYTLYDPDHSYCLKDSYGYGQCPDKKALTDRIEAMYENMIYPSIPQGLCGMVYTQVSDIEDEVNGFYTYDRKVCKADPGRLRRMNEKADQLLKESTGITGSRT